jgi:hypothetical protein
MIKALEARVEELESAKRFVTTASEEPHLGDNGNDPNRLAFMKGEFLPDLPKPFPVRLEDLYDPTFSDGLSPSEHLDRLYGHRAASPLPTEENMDDLARDMLGIALPDGAGARLIGRALELWWSAAAQQEASEQLGAIAGPAEAPTDDELLRTYGAAKRDHQYDGPNDDWPNRAERAATVCGLRAVLARYGRPTFQPIPVSERLPGADELEASFRDWWKDRHGSAGLDAVPLAPFIIEWTKFALARYGRPAPEPATKCNRPILTSNPFYNEDGECWCFESADGEWDVPASWHLRVPYHTDEYFLPHYHFPEPGNHSPDATKMAELEGQS